MAKSLRVFVSHSSHDNDLALRVVDELDRSGFQPWSVEVSVPLGAAWEPLLTQAIDNAEVFVLLVSRRSLDSDYFRNVEWPQIKHRVEHRAAPLVPVFLADAPWDEIPTWLTDRQGVVLRSNLDVRRLVSGLSRLSSGDSLEGESRRDSFSSALLENLNQPGPALRLGALSIEGIRSLGALELEALPNGLLALGDNASGKSTLLRAIALGACDESTASALLHELPGSMIQSGCDKATINLVFESPDRQETVEVRTQIYRQRDSEVIRKETNPDPFPWDDLFVCGYGTNRGRQATASHESYSVREAVRTLFDDEASLQNPELILLRQSNGSRRFLEQQLLSVLMLDQGAHGITYPESGPSIRGPWGEQPIKVLSDGYRSTMQWILDVYAWALYANRLAPDGSIGGILLLDEIEQHLHPRWQREILTRLRKQFPGTQILATTHTPLVVAGAADTDDVSLVRLKVGTEGQVVPIRVDPEEVRGKSADQILTSAAFGLLTTRSPGTLDELDRWTELHAKAERSEDEEAELAALAEKIRAETTFGASAYEQAVQEAVDEALARVAHDFDPERLDLETRWRLRELFAREEDEA